MVCGHQGDALGMSWKWIFSRLSLSEGSALLQTFQFLALISEHDALKHVSSTLSPSIASLCF